MYERFTDRARQAMRAARQRGERHVWPTHLLLAMLEAHPCVATTVLTNLGVDLAGLQNKLLEAPEREALSERQRAGQLREGKFVVESALLHVRALNHDYIGTEHLLLGLANLPNHPVASLLCELGATRDALRQEILRVLADSQSAAPTIPEPTLMFRLGRVLARAWAAIKRPGQRPRAPDG